MKLLKNFQNIIMYKTHKIGCALIAIAGILYLAVIVACLV